MNHKKFTGQINSENDIHLKIHQDFRNLEQKLYQVQQEKDDLIVENRKLRNQLTDCEERCLHLTAQLCAYKEDFETERSDRERAQGSLIDLNLKVQQLQQELDRQVQHGEDKQQQLQNDVHKQGLYTRNQSLEQKRSCTLNDQSSQQEEFLLPQQQRQQRQQQSHSQQQREQKIALQQQLKQQPWQEPQLQQPYQQQQQASGKFERQQGLNQNQQQRQQCYQQQLKLKQQQQRVQQQQQLSDTPVVQNGQIEKQQHDQILERRRLLESVDKQQQQLQQKQFKCDEKQTRQNDCGPIHRSHCSIDNYDRFDDVTHHHHYHSVSHEDSDDNTAEDVYSAACMTIHPANQNSTTCTSSALSEFTHHSCTAPMSQVSSAPRRPFVGGVALAGKNNFSDLEISSRPVASTTFTESSGLNTPATVAELSSGRYHETQVRNSDLDRTVPKIIPAACGSASEEDNNVTSGRYDVKNAAGFSKTYKPPRASHVSTVCIASTVAHSKYVDSFCKSGMHAKHASDADPLHIENDISNAFTGDASSAAAIDTGAATCPVSVAAAASSASTYAIVGNTPNAFRNVDITTSIDAENTTNNNNKKTNSSASKLLTHRITEAIPGAVTAAAVVVYPLVDMCDKFNISSSAILDTSDTTLAAALPDTHRKTSATVAVAGRGDTAADAVGGRSDTAADAGGGAGYFKTGGTNLDSTGNLKTVSKTSSNVETSRYLYEANSATFEGSTNVQTLEPFHQRPPPAEKQSEVTDLHGGHERVQREKEVSLQNVTSSGLTRYGLFSNQDNDHRSPDDILNLKTNGIEHGGDRLMNKAEETSKRSDSENVGITKPVKKYTSEGKPMPCHLRYGSATAKCRPNTPNELITGEKAKFPFYGHEYKPHTTAQYLELESDTAINHDYSFSRNDDRNNMKHDRIDHTSDHTSDHTIDRRPTNSAIQMLPQKPYYNTDAGYEYYDNELNQTRNDNAHNAVNDDYDDIDAGDDCNTDTQRHHSYQTGADDAASGIQCHNESAESRTGVELTGSSTEESLRCPVCNESFTAAQQHMLLDHILNVCLQ